MESALQKVDVPLMERYHTICENCRFEKQFFGTVIEARKSALEAGWEFRLARTTFKHAPFDLPEMKELAYCPHCQLLVKPDAPVAQSTRAPSS